MHYEVPTVSNVVTHQSNHNIPSPRHRNQGHHATAEDDHTHCVLCVVIIQELVDDQASLSALKYEFL